MSGFTTDLAVIIGINRYGNGVPELRTPVNDAEALGDLLRDKFGYTTWLRLDEEATKPRLTELFTKELPNSVLPDSRVLLYFAGHGVAEDNDQSDGPEGYLLPQDADQDLKSFISMREVYNGISMLPCRHLMAIFDCCFAGAFRWASTRDVLPTYHLMHEERYRHYISHPAWQVLTSAAYDQRAQDRTVAGKAVGKRGMEGNHSPFAAQLLDGLAGAADVFPIGGDGVITASELHAFLQNTIPSSQTPNLWPLPKHKQGEFVFRDRRSPRALDSAPPLYELQNPYRGLKPYDKEHAHLFFGRTGEVRKLAEKVTSSPLTVVVGPSGTGKSSLVRAGLVSELGKRNGDWELLSPLRPGSDPFASLAGALSSTTVAGLRELPSQQLRDDGTLSSLITEWSLKSGGRLLLVVVDQAEELLTTTSAEGDHALFLRVLAQALAANRMALRVVITVRSDFEPQIAKEALNVYWSDARFTISPLTQNELRDVVERPASERVLFFDTSELVNDLVNEVVQMPGALPLLSFTLSEMYLQYLRSRRRDRELTRAEYEAVGGVIGSLRKRANDEYESLPDDAHRATMRRIMLRMMATEGGELARRRAPRAEFDYADGAGPLLSPADIVEPQALAAHLAYAQDPLSSYIWECFSAEARQVLSRQGTVPEASSNHGRILATELNRMIQGPALYDPARFEQLELSSKTRQLVEQRNAPGTTAQCNRHLLEDAYPGLRSENSRVDWVFRKLDQARLIVLGDEET